MGFAPLADPIDVFGAAEVVAVLRFAQPAALALGFAGLAALGLAAELLMPAVAKVRIKQLVAMQTLTPIGLSHGP